ncbi:MAG: hypothetical protein AAF927_21900 [Bacteroidota bacterium]
MSTIVNPAYSDPLDCITTWKQELAVAQQGLARATAQYNAASRRYTGAKEWVDQLSTYWDNIQKTDELAKAVLDQLPPFMEHAETLTSNTEHTVKAARILICDLEDVIDCADELQKLIKDLMDVIKGLETQKLATKPMKILPVLESLSTKFNEAYQGIIDSILKAIDVLDGSDQLHYSLEKYAGLIRNLEEIKNQFDKPDPPTYCTHAPNNNSCQDELNSKPVFSLADNKNVYYLTTKEQFEKACDEIAEIEAEKVSAEARKKAFQACVDSLSNAINTAETAKACG